MSPTTPPVPIPIIGNPMQVLVSGASGLVGTRLVERLQRDGHEAIPLVRHRDQAGVYWDPATYELADDAALDSFDAMIHLAGEPIVGRWSPAKKQRIRRSRIDSTRQLAQAIGRQCGTTRPVVIVASAIGFYGDRGTDCLDEGSSQGCGFLAEVCRDWEAAAEPARAAGCRVAHVRFGMLLSPEGGALKKMVPPFKAGIGGRLGTGTQFMSWATIEDAVEAILHVWKNQEIQGPVNIVSPTPCTNLEFTKTLGRVLRRPTIFPVPAVMARRVFGEMADALLMASQRVAPRRLQESGFEFKQAELEPALRAMLKGL